MHTAPIRLLNRSIRALAQAAAASEWKEIFLDSAAHFCERALLLRAGSREFVLEGARGVEREARLTILREAAPAMEEAVRSGETIVSACAASELSHPIASLLVGAARVHIFPLVQGDQPVAALAASGVADPAAIELLSAAASLALRRNATADVVPLTTVPREPAPKEKPRELRARHFARVAVARMVLRHPSAVAAGRRGRNLYSTLAPVIDAAREQFSARFLSDGGRMADYLHEELVRNVARNEESILGAEYPGPLA